MISVASAIETKQKADEPSPTAEGYLLQKSQIGCSAFGVSKQGCVFAPHSQPASVIGAQGRRASARKGIGVERIGGSKFCALHQSRAMESPWNHAGGKHSEPTSIRGFDGPILRRNL